MFIISLTHIYFREEKKSIIRPSLAKMCEHYNDVSRGPNMISMGYQIRTSYGKKFLKVSAIVFITV